MPVRFTNEPRDLGVAAFLIILVTRRFGVDSDMPVLGYLPVQVDNTVVIFEEMRHQAVDIVSDYFLLPGIGRQIEVDGVTIEDGVEIVHADVAVKAIAGVGV